MKMIKLIVTIGMALGLASTSYAAKNSAWLSNDVVTSESCTNIGYDDVVKFIDDYYLPALGYLPAADDIEEQFFEVYVISSAVTLRSQLCLAESLELKGLTDELLKEQALIKSGTSFGKNELEKQRQLTEAADLQIRQASEQVGELKPEQKKTFAMGVATYLAGAYATSEMVKVVDDVAKKAAEDAKNTGSDLKNAAKDPGKAIGGFFKKKDKSASDGALKNPAKVVTFFTELLPGVKDQVKRLYTTSTYLTEFSAKNGIELPADATSKLDGVLDWE
jgi:hypothetical protein